VAETNRQVSDFHRRAFRQQLDARARRLSGRVTRDMLGELADDGFAWRDIARLVGVSVPALRRWRQGESPTGDHRLTIARLVALIEILQDDHMITEVASWMEMPLSREAPVTGIDLGAAGRYEDLLDLAANHAGAEEILDRWQADWREQYRSNFEAFEAPDGQPGIRPIAREGSVGTCDV
jgi:transcriptional regulator with XRE-family HTH domain